MYDRYEPLAGAPQAPDLSKNPIEGSVILTLTDYGPKLPLEAALGGVLKLKVHLSCK